MKIFKIGLICLLFSATFSLAQETDFGLKAGINFSTLSGDSTKNYEGRDTSVDSKTGFYFGGFMQYELYDKFAVQPELLISYQGANIEIRRWEGIPVEAEGDVAMPYILLPVMLQYEPMADLIIEIGPQIGYNLSKEIKVKGKVELNDETINLEERIKDVALFDFSLAAGLGYEFMDDFTAKLRFAQGLNSLDQRDTDGFDLYNRVFSLGVEYEF